MTIHIDLSDPETFMCNLALLDSKLRKEAKEAKTGLVDLQKVVRDCAPQIPLSEAA